MERPATATFATLGDMHASLPTPCVLVNLAAIQRNITTMNTKIRQLANVRFRPHVKTHKSIQIARMQTAGHFGGITVSTIAEVLYFYAAGYTDILYAVGMIGKKVSRVASVVRAGLRLSVIVDSVAAVEQIAFECAREGIMLHVLIEVDCGYLRGGLAPEDATLLEVAAAVQHAGPQLHLEGVLTHGGHGYCAKSVEDLVRIAAQERDSLVAAAHKIRGLGLECTVVSAGSTPTALHLDDATGLTEIRAGVYAFQDLDQAGIGSCCLQDIALHVLTSVIGYQPSAQKLLVDAGGLALSKDVSAQQHGKTVGFGLIADNEDLYVATVSQEHGHLKRLDGQPIDYTKFPIGSSLRIVPHHSCFTAAAHDKYHMFFESSGQVQVWEEPRLNGW